MLCDLHVHSTFSMDSDVSMDVHCQTAQRLGFDCICFTDHLEGNPADPGYHFFDFDGYFQELEQVRQRYGQSLRILSGAEISEPHLYPRLVEKCHRYPFDLLLGSVHFWVGDLFPNQMKQMGISAQDSFSLYWQQVELAAEAGGFDVFAHFDYPKRFYYRLLFEPEQIQRIFTSMQKNHINLEINCGGFRRQNQEANPGETLLNLYRQAGGTFVTLGSDAHRLNTFGYGIDRGLKLMEQVGLRQIWYEMRQPQPVASV